MRLVTEEQARVIYDTIYAHLSSSPDICPFSVKRSDLKTITGTEEGVHKIKQVVVWNYNMIGF